ncbi:hypothetical protein NKH09_24570 [Mesorhizobium sp. M1339]|uniref:hypothetical protein n=1 Tax=Mesorhizobium sp. M1339 TaxID=2957086 RepID=UPI0033376D88
MKSKIEAVSLRVDMAELLDLYSRAVESGDSTAAELAGNAIAEAGTIGASHSQMLVYEAMAIRRLK